MAAGKSQLEIAESEDWLLPTARTLSELLKEIDMAASMCDATAHSAMKRMRQLSLEAMDAFQLIRKLERYRSTSEQLKSMATQAAKRGDLVVATAAALKLGRLLATVIAIRENLGGKISHDQVKRKTSDVNRKNASGIRSRPDVTGEKVRKFKKDFLDRHGTERGWLIAAEVKFDMERSTLSRRAKQE